MIQDFGIRQNEDPLRQEVNWLEFQNRRFQKEGIPSVPAAELWLAVAKFAAEKIIERRKVENL